MFRIRRKSKFENRYHKNMGRLITKVTKIQRTFLGIPIQTIHTYRETYYGEVKDVKNCKLNK